MLEETAGGQHSLISRFPPFITAWIPNTTSFQCSREWKTRKSFLSFTTVSFLSILPLCVCVRTQHSCSISSGFSPCYPLKKEKKLKTGFQLPLSRRHTVLTADIFHTSCSKARDAIFSATGEEQTNQSATKTTRVRAFKNEISSSNFGMCCSTNARSIVCHLHFTNYSHFSHATMLPEPSVIQMKHFQHYHPKHENLTIYSTDSQASIVPNSELACQER